MRETSKPTKERVRETLGDCLAVAQVSQEWRPPLPDEHRAWQNNGPVTVTVHEQKLVTILPVHEWTRLVFALHDLFHEVDE